MMTVVALEACLQLVTFLAQRYPDILQAIEEGRTANLDWESIMPSTKKALRQEVDQTLDISQKA